MDTIEVFPDERDVARSRLIAAAAAYLGSRVAIHLDEFTGDGTVAAAYQTDARDRYYTALDALECGHPTTPTRSENPATFEPAR